MCVPELTPNFATTGCFVDPSLLTSLDPQALALLAAEGRFLEAAGEYLQQLAALNSRFVSTSVAQTAPVGVPCVEDCIRPTGSLTVDGDTIRTPGGYEITQIGATEWMIKGPDGATTRVHGDPHVDEGDRDGGTDWDFKRNTTFVLDDGTEIHVKCVPGGAAGATITGQLDIISGNDFVSVTDIDKGKGVIGNVTQDGRSRTNDYGGYDVVEQGDQVDDWIFKGREIVGSTNQGEEFITRAIEGTPRRDFDIWASSLVSHVFTNWSNDFADSLGFNPYSGNERPIWADTKPYRADTHRANLRESLYLMSAMFKALGDLATLSDQLTANRRQYICQA